MLDPSELKNLVEIAELATNEMYSRGYSQFLIESVRWHDDDDVWLVDFYCEVGNIENLSISIEVLGKNYKAKGIYWS